MLIGLCGYPGVGKTEVTKILTRDYGYEILDTKKPLRDITSIITGIPSDDFKMSKIKNNHYYYNYPMREIMGEVGLFLENMFGDDYLLNKALDTIPGDDGKYIIDAFRRDQAHFFDGYLLEITSERVPEPVFDFDRYSRSKIDYTIDNSGSIEDLEVKIKEMMLDISSRIN